MLPCIKRLYSHFSCWHNDTSLTIVIIIKGYSPIYSWKIAHNRGSYKNLPFHALLNPYYSFKFRSKSTIKVLNLTRLSCSFFHTFGLICLCADLLITYCLMKTNYERQLSKKRCHDLECVSQVIYKNLGVN